MQGQEISTREAWGSKVAFIFAATGSAIGLGNIWRFPTVVSQNGGAVFVLVYVLAVAFIGFTVMLAELTIGRHTQRNPVGAFESIKPRTPWKFIGYLGMITGVCILSFYAVVAGWAAGYIFKMASGALKGKLTAEMSNKIFTEFSSDPIQVFLFFGLIMGLTIFIVSKGVKKGIERWTKVLMPVLFLLIVFLAIRALTLPGAGKGIAFYLRPDFSKLNGTVILYALGQAFFSLSLGMGTMITYGSYISKKDNLVSSAGWVTFSDTFIALLAGLIIFPTLAFSGQPGNVGDETLAFKIFPLIFPEIPGGQIFGIFFFTLLTVAAITSTISLLEVPVAYFVDERNWSRKKAALVIGLFTFVLGVPAALSTGGMQFFTKIKVLGLFAFIFGNISLAVGALFICIFVGYIWGIKKALKEISSGNPRFKLRPIWVFSLKFLSPIAILIILYFIKTLKG
ncbi:MAG: sodium-dependent transporter [Candidatus Aminicenantes bacterium]|nr:sodium-dependent transporter [Candidatus Aminicenantes bacterium]MBL7083520.1 sodium-dependent transporter [Candidatus Aminicenantes bacterium]